MKLKALFASACLMVVGASAQAAEVELTLSHWVPATHMLQAGGMEPWAKSINEASGGRINITIYPASQLGAAPDHYDMARDGIVDIGFINPGYQPGRFPILAAGEIPFLISDAKSGSRALDEWYRQYSAKEMSDVYVCMVHVHDPGTLHGTKGPIQVPADLKGKNIRPAHATMARLVSSLGAASVQVPAGEMRELISKGAADMTASPWNSIYTFGLQDVTKHHLDMPFYVTTFAFVMNKAKIDGLEPQDRKVIDDHCTSEWAEKMASKWADAEAAGRQKMIDAGGHTFYKPTPDEVNLWKQATASLEGEWAAAATKAGIEAKSAWASLAETLKKYDANVK
ncbi:TRAP-type C4-dicarboxylate transport system substrate-binding protein [Rhizobium petrolearium]|uniref:TRAP transporter substrate-binding protein n=1 Tax=Neorhizobium petrolearium TaxID=515361 RepID=UPI001AE6BE0C|nr:TRAP transporter substrate-binding protein [Neorhizobium petrolearium]MBP1844903.1 TRAP-type C4-dicarboxylate transport system substrate-binding protein [Neorhizobium petrolearium]